MFGPLFCAYLCEKASVMILFKIVLTLHIIGYIFFVLFSRVIQAEARQKQIQQLGGEVSGKLSKVVVKIFF